MALETVPGGGMEKEFGVEGRGGVEVQVLLSVIIYFFFFLNKTQGPSPAP